MSRISKTVHANEMAARKAKRAKLRSEMQTVERKPRLPKASRNPVEMIARAQVVKARSRMIAVGKTYAPNGAREITRRLRKLKIIDRQALARAA